MGEDGPDRRGPSQDGPEGRDPVQDDVPRNKSSLAPGITAFLGWLTGLATLAYAIGVVVYALRLSLNRVPSPLATASALPRELLIATSLSNVVLPVAIVAGIHLLYRLGSPTRHPLFEYEGIREANWKRALPAAFFAIALTLFYPLLAFSLAHGREGVGALFYLAVFAFSLVIVAVAFALRGIARRRLRRDPRLVDSTKTRLVLTLAYASAVLPGAMVIGATLELAEAKVCKAGGAAEVSGLLIGMTTERIYVAQPPAQLVVIASSVAEEVLVGEQASSLKCNDSATSSTVAP